MGQEMRIPVVINQFCRGREDTIFRSLPQPVQIHPKPQRVAQAP